MALASLQNKCHNLGELLRRLLGLIRSPLVKFVVCSVVYLAVMAKSYRDSAKNIAGDNAGNNISDSIVEMGQFLGMVQFEEVGDAYVVQYMERMPWSVHEAVYEDKEIVNVVKSTRASTPACHDVETDRVEDVESPRINRWSQSENLELEVKQQHRSEAKTFECMDPEEVLSENSCKTDELNDEELKETIDAIIKSNISSIATRLAMITMAKGVRLWVLLLTFLMLRCFLF